MRFRLGCMNQVRKFHSVLNEKNGDVVADQIPVTLVSVKFNRETSHIAHRIGRAAFSDYGRKAHKDRCAFASLSKKRCSSIFLKRLIAFEIPMGGRTSGMDYALGYTLVVKMGDLLAKNKILEQRGPAISCF